MHLRLTLICLGVVSSLGQAAVNCSVLAENISGTVPEFHPVLGGEVIGRGRAYFYTAPDEACTNKKVFVVPGDALIIYSILQDESWLEVNFVAKDGQDYTGWVKADRVKMGAPYGLPSDGG